jgi:ubiquinone/menaquinone biosynthesis C-methylase UbiE
MLINWINEKNTARTAQYWNDFEQEKEKVFNISDGDFKKLEENQHLGDIYNHLVEVSNAEHIVFKEKQVLSLAAGTCWLEGRFFNDKDIKRLVAIDFSKHRIHDLASLTIEHYKLTEKVDLVYGSILDLKVKDQSQDIVLLSQAFHHINEPIRLLSEIKRVLKPNGVIIIVGEHYYNWKVKLIGVAKHFAKYLLNYKKCRDAHSFVPSYQALFPPCYEKGDIHYSKLEYHHMFVGTGFGYKHFIDRTKTIQAFVLNINE